MSKLAEAIAAKRLNQKVAHMPYFDVRDTVVEEKDRYMMPTYRYIYRFGASFAVEAACGCIEEVEYQKKLATEQFVNHIFGEFREPLYEAMRECYYMGRPDAAKKIEQVLDSMFEV